MKIVIVGAGAVGTHLSKLLSREHQDCILIDDDEERLAKMSEYDVMTYCASPTSIKALKEAGTPNADLFVGVTPEESTNINACILAHALGAKKTVARIDNYEYLSPSLQPFFKNLGLDSLIYPEVLAAIDINNGLKLSWVRQRWDVHDGALILLGIKLREQAEILNQPLKDLCGPDDPYHIVAIKRGGDTIIPSGLDELRVGDLAYFMTTKEYIPRETLRRVSTPQAYQFKKLDWAYHEAFEKEIGIYGSAYTNTMMVELGETLHFAAGSDKNIKLTTKDDLELFKGYLNMDKDTWLK